MNKFLTNYTEETFLEHIKDNLRRCNSFSFSVSFIKKAGLVLLLNDIKAAVERGAKGRIITSTYQNFTDIESLRSFLSLQNTHDNFECHLDYDSFVDSGYMVIGYHSKGYFFEFEGDEAELIVGSSNITRYALLKNIEWDLVVNDCKANEAFAQASREFEEKWQQTEPLTDEIIRKYTKKLNFAIERWDMDYDLEQAPVKPNYMQRKALKELNRYRAIGTNKALVVAAAGSGKTYLAAFDAFNFNPDKLLYIVHEGSILEKSYETFQIVFGGDKSYGIFGGGNKEIDADFLFATNISMANNLELFDKKEFDYIIIDECHHAAADTYKKIMNYFEPEFMIGLTATPERMDNEDVFDLFDANVPYELRLRDAIINDLVVPFHYYGIRDNLVEMSKENERKMKAQIASQDNCEFIRQQIEGHRVEGKLKALAFCKDVAHAQMMSEALGEYYYTAYLSGKSDVGARIRAYNDLQDDDSELEVLCSVDILNEGVDIPGVNMVLFLRPTESQTVFIQQLGRGLRKYEGKDYVTVLDFIGNNYRRSVQIALALGNLSKNFVLEKKLLVNMVQDNFKALGLEKYGVIVNIDDLSKQEICSFIENENFYQKKYLEQDYRNFKKYVNAETFPSHMDYLNNDCAPDLIKFMNVKMKKPNAISSTLTRSYYNFLLGVNEENTPVCTAEQVELFDYLSSLLPLVREHEYNLAEKMLEAPVKLTDYADDAEYSHAINFMLESGCFSAENGEISFRAKLDEQSKAYIKDLLNYGRTRYKIDFLDCDTQFKLWHSYRKDQVLLKLCQNPKYTQVGTYYFNNQVFIFVALKKELDAENRLNYADKFIDEKTMQWESMTNLPKADLEKLTAGNDAHIFVRKVEDENGITMPFTYVGVGKLNKDPKGPGKNGTWLFNIDLANSLPDDLQYDMIF